MAYQRARRPLAIGRILGVPIELERSWFVLSPLVVLFFATYAYRGRMYGAEAAIAVIALLAAAVFFLSVLLHELGHAWLARLHGFRVRSMRFAVFGGLTEMERQPDSGKAEFAIAIAGPAVSTILGVVLFLAAALLEEWPTLSLQCRLLGRINILLAGFNLIPAFPLDGGRALRAALWAISGDYAAATRRTTVWSRQAVRFLMLAGAASMVLYRPTAGLLVLLIAWRLNDIVPQDHSRKTVNSQAEPVR